MASALTAFRYDDERHQYFAADGAQVPHITGLLKEAGLVDARFYTDASRDRGHAVHALTAAYDLGALDLEHCRSCYRDYVLAHAACMQALRPTFTAIEVPDVHPTLRFGGRPDRVGKILRAQSIVEIKTGSPEKWHAVQTALQAILVAWRGGLPASAYARYAAYYTARGRYSVELFTDRRDFDTALEIVRRWCR